MVITSQLCTETGRENSLQQSQTVHSCAGIIFAAPLFAINKQRCASRVDFDTLNRNPVPPSLSCQRRLCSVCALSLILCFYPQHLGVTTELELPTSVTCACPCPDQPFLTLTFILSARSKQLWKTTWKFVLSNEKLTKNPPPTCTSASVQQVLQESLFLCHSLNLDLTNQDQTISQAMHLFQWMAEYKCSILFWCWCLTAECETRLKQNVTFNYTILWQSLPSQKLFQGRANVCLIPDKAWNMSWCLP